MRYSEPALLYEDQLALLIGRGLFCPDRTLALQRLKWIGYYRLSAYFIPFRIAGTDNFRPGTTLDASIDFYRFDADLRLLVLQAMDSIEVGIRAVVAYRLGQELGPFGYANPTNFPPAYKHAELLRIIAIEECRSSELFVSHYRRAYSETHLPVWIATELIPFGVLSKMHGNVRTGIRKRVAREFNQLEPVFGSWVHSLAAARNICAHHSRLWNRELAVKPELPAAWKAQGVDNRRFYVIALIIQSLMEHVSPDSRWKDRLQAHFNAYPSVDIAQMDFPPSWKSPKPWKEKN